MATQKLLDQLRAQIRGVETAGRMHEGVRVSSGCAAVDRLLPENGYQRGTLVQWLTGGGQGADYLSLLVARHACQDGGALVVFDPFRQFYPPAAAAMGINLDNLIVLRSEGRPGEQASQADLLWSIDQALRCPAVAAVWGPLTRIDERWFRRFQLSAEASGCLGLFVQPIQAARQPSWAEVQWVVSQLSNSHRSPLVSTDLSNSADSEQRLRLQLTRCRGTQTGKTVELSINTITGNVRPARRDYEQHLRAIRKSDRQTYPREGARSDATGSQADALPVVSQLANSAVGRQRA